MDHFGPPGEEMIKFFEINENFREKHDIYVILYRGVTTKSELEKYVHTTYYKNPKHVLEYCQKKVKKLTYMSSKVVYIFITREL